MHDLIPPRDHNRPPSLIDFANESATVLGDWLKEHPVVETEEAAKDGKLLIDRTRLCLQDLEAERKTRVSPLQQQIRAFDDEYRSPRRILEKILDELKERLNAWIKKEEEKRLQALEEARKKAAEAEKLAREAEEREKEAIEEAKAGVEVEITSATKEADAKFGIFQTAQRDLARAEKATDVKITGGFTRALSSRFKEELQVTDPLTAVGIMGWSSRILEAILTDAREYRRSHGKLPQGIVSKGERRL